ncbi:MAG: N-acetyl-gamma-glutamyl-phosphate reductase [Oscillospiraceae bacterium]|nr:N-acetyl-gamma-glutamyl-phosphate reductase [Oscillospiraceae bacterium]
MAKVFIDGRAGTTGLRIYERLEQRSDITLLTLREEERKDPAARKRALNACDAAFLCLPDDAAREAVSLVENPGVVILDTSTAHRTEPGWAYGFPELSAAHREHILDSRRIAVPGCHASGFIVLVYPLVAAGLLSAETALSCFSLTGYSGGGKKMIADYEAEGRSELLSAPRQYGLTQQHKHLKEMTKISGLRTAPAFCPVVADFYSGMEVTVPIFGKDLRGGMEEVRAVYRAAYSGPVVRFAEHPGEGGFLSAAALSGKDGMEISVCGNEERLLLAARYDNLGKGASGAAIQCLNLILGCGESCGLCL